MEPLALLMASGERRSRAGDVLMRQASSDGWGGSRGPLGHILCLGRLVRRAQGGAAGRGVDLAANGCSPSEDGEQTNGGAISSFKMPPSVERAGVIDHADHEPLRKSPKVRVATRWRAL